METSMAEQFDKVMYWYGNLLYNEKGGAATLNLSEEMLDDLWNFYDGFPVFLNKWLNGMGSLNWIMSNTPEMVQKKLDAGEALIKSAYEIVGRELPKEDK